MLLHLLIQLKNNIPGALTLLFRCWCFVFPNDQNIKKTFTPNPNVGNIPLHCHLCLVKSNENSLPFAVNNFNSCSKFGHVVSAAKQIWYDPIGVLSLQDASWGLSPAATYIQSSSINEIFTAASHQTLWRSFCPLWIPGGTNVGDYWVLYF